MPDIPIVSMIERSSWIARTILIALAVESVIAWGVILNRLTYLGKARKLNRLFRDRYEKAEALAELEKPDARTASSHLAALAGTGAAEYRRILADAHSHTNVKDWSFFLETQFAMVNERFTSLSSQLSAQLDKWAYVLAIVSSSAPFIGLLGTVWGIMDAFFEIGKQGSASLPAVAPGIAEALTATAIALIVAIPAAIFYNIVLTKAQRAEDEIYEFKDLLIARLRREVLSVLFGPRPAAREPQPVRQPGTP